MKLATLTAAMAVSLGSLAFGQAQTNDQPSDLKTAPTKGPEDTSGGFTIEGKTTFLNKYVSRGYTYHEDGLTVQPEITLSNSFVRDDLTVTPYVNLWADITDEKYRRTNYFNELDVTAGVSFEKNDYTLSFEYIYYTSPGDNYDDIHELGVTLEHSDYLNPHISLYQEFIDQNQRVATYLEAGIAPEYKVNDKLNLSFPITLGMSPNDYYYSSDGDNQLFGFASAGVTAKYDVTENWYILVGAEYDRLLASSTKASNDGDENNLIVSAAVGFSY